MTAEAEAAVVVDKLMAGSQPAMVVAKKQEEAEEQHPLGNLSYFCKICSKRFGSGRALGGHMRAHGPVAMAENSDKKRLMSAKSMEEEEEEVEEEEEEVDRIGSDNPMYTLRRNPKRSWRFADREYSFLMGHELESRPINSSSICDVCGKEFPSWKSLFGHMKCHSDRLWKTHQDVGDAYSQKSETESREEEQEGSMDYDSEAEIEQQHASEGGNSNRLDRWMKGKRSKRPRYAIQPQSHNHQLHPIRQEQLSCDNNEDEDMAICLVMLASGVNTCAQKLESQGGAKEEPGPQSLTGSADLKLPNTIIKKRPKTKVVDANGDPYDAKKTRYECTTCNKTFISYQALGGHRASHKKIKGCFSRMDVPEENESLEEEITDDEPITKSDSQLPNNFQKPSPPKEETKVSSDEAREESGETTVQPPVVSSVKKTRIHECSICHRIFASGQALGGHKRCHWGSAGTSDTISTLSSTKEPPVQQPQKQQQGPATLQLLDLNLPAPVDDECDARQFNGLGGNVVDSHRPSDVEIQSKIGPPIFQSWWMGNYPKQGMFLYNNRTHLSREDEADSKQGKKIVFGRVQDLQAPNRAQQPWLQL
uniref:TSA: Wollemia nobilis Ref_Wollemi_Transcript_25048_2114 transcribed RNA sequence n=1 Tax=Wollemia nobilis TaxID=56998 RepID=A0A0C9RQJ1_9CONI